MTLVHKYKQAEDDRTNDDDMIKVTGGWCIGMVVHWIQHKKAGTDFWKKAMTPEGEQAFRMLMALQLIWNKQGGWAQKHEFDIYDKLLAGKKIKRVNYSDSRPKQVISSDEVWRVITGTSGTYGIVALGFLRGGHALGVAKNNDDSFSVLDPSHGEFNFKDAADFRNGIKTEIFDKRNQNNPVARLIISKYQ